MIALALLLPAAAATAPAGYRALGTEPFWNVAIRGGRVTVSEPGVPDIRLKARPATAVPRGWRWRAPGFDMTAVREPCSDGMSDRTYPDRVTVRWRGRTWNGCGEVGSEPLRLEGAAWRIAAVDGRRVTLPASQVTLRFDGARLLGQAGCNRVSGRWQLGADRLTVADVAMTRRFCAGEAGTIERRFAAIVAAPLQVSREGGNLVLHNRTGTLTLAPAS